MVPCWVGVRSVGMLSRLRLAFVSMVAVRDATCSATKVVSAFSLMREVRPETSASNSFCTTASSGSWESARRPLMSANVVARSCGVPAPIFVRMIRCSASVRLPSTLERSVSALPAMSVSIRATITATSASLAMPSGICPSAAMPVMSEKLDPPPTASVAPMRVRMFFLFDRREINRNVLQVGVGLACQPQRHFAVPGDGRRDVGIGHLAGQVGVACGHHHLIRPPRRFFVRIASCAWLVRPVSNVGEIGVRLRVRVRQRDLNRLRWALATRALNAVAAASRARRPSIRQSCV